MKARVVLFDDDVHNLKLYTDYLCGSFECHKFMNPFDYENALELNPDIIILDVMMPLLDGPALYKKIIESVKYNGCPILFISASHADEVLMSALKSGGQGFLSRSMNQEEIVYRVRNTIDYFKENRNIFRLGEVKVDMKNLKVFENENCVDLTLTELKLLKTLLTRHPLHMTREEITEEIWPGLKVQSNTLNTHLSNLRGKFSKWSYEIQHIKNHGIVLVPKA